MDHIPQCGCEELSLCGASDEISVISVAVGRVVVSTTSIQTISGFYLPFPTIYSLSKKLQILVNGLR